MDFELETNAFWVTPVLGTTDNGSIHSKIKFQDIEVDIPSIIVDRPRIIELTKLYDINFTSQPDFEIIPIPDKYDGIEIKINGSTEYSVNWSLNESISQYDKNLYQYYNDNGIWLPIDFIIQNDSVGVIQTTGSTKLAFINSNDSEKPSLSATVNNQEYLKDIFVSKNPNISISIYDKNGVDFRESALRFLVNNQQQDNFEYETSGSTNTLNLSFSPSLTSLDSSITLISSDAAGNKSDSFKIAFSVSEEIDILDFGNFPNPFSDKTIFAYELTDQVDEITFTIFTVEGRRIRKLINDDITAGPSMNLPGYHELEWDGKNSERNIVDNGNYFYQIRAKKDKKSVVKIGKILKIK